MCPSAVELIWNMKLSCKSDFNSICPFAFTIIMTTMRITFTIIFSIIITIFAVDGVTVERALVLVASEKGLAYWAYKWTHSPARVHMKVYRKVYTQKSKHGIKKAYKWIHSPCGFRLATYDKYRYNNIHKYTHEQE